MLIFHFIIKYIIFLVNNFNYFRLICIKMLSSSMLGELANPRIWFGGKQNFHVISTCILTGMANYPGQNTYRTVSIYYYCKVYFDVFIFDIFLCRRKILFFFFFFWKPGWAQWYWLGNVKRWKYSDYWGCLRKFMRLFYEALSWSHVLL